MMKKDDLKDGMVVENRVGNRYLIFKKRLLREGSFVRTSSLDDNMNTIDKNIEYLDVMKVYKPHDYPSSMQNMLEVPESYLIWERKEIDWNKVEVDTKIIVKENEESKWVERHFSGYRNEKIYAWLDGTTSHTVANLGKSSLDCSWTYADLVDVK